MFKFLIILDILENLIVIPSNFTLKNLLTFASSRLPSCFQKIPVQTELFQDLVNLPILSFDLPSKDKKT
jgi:hypothetical protein